MRIEQVAEHIAGNLQDLDTADRQEGEAAEARSVRLVEKIDRFRAQMAMETEVEAAPDGQVSVTDSDVRAMATSGRDSGIVGYDVQSAVEGDHHLIVAHDVVMIGLNKHQLASMALKAEDGRRRRGNQLPTSGFGTDGGSGWRWGSSVRDPINEGA